MKKLAHLVIMVSVSSIWLLSCTPSEPYEIKSPCVSGGLEDHPYGHTPCPRRPANINYAIV